MGFDRGHIKKYFTHEKHQMHVKLKTCECSLQKLRGKALRPCRYHKLVFKKFITIQNGAVLDEKINCNIQFNVLNLIYPLTEDIILNNLDIKKKLIPVMWSVA